MPYMVTKVNYPTDKNNEVVKTYLEVLQKLPPDDSLGELVVQASPRRSLKGIKAMNIFKVKTGKLEEAMALAEKQSMMFNNIVGYESETEIWNTMEEGFASLEIDPPS